MAEEDEIAALAYERRVCLGNGQDGRAEHIAEQLRLRGRDLDGNPLPEKRKTRKT